MSEEEKMPKEKEVKAMDKMFKSIKGAGFAAGPLGAVFSALEFLEPLLKPLEVILTIVGGLFQVMAAEILPPLMESMQPLFDFLIELTPLFEEIGEMIGSLVAEFLPPFIEMLVAFLKALIPLLPKIMQLIEAIIRLAIQIMPIVIDVFLKIANVIITVLQPILNWLGGLSASQLGAVIYVFGLGLSALYGLMHGGPYIAALYAGMWAGFMSPLLAFQEGAVATKPVMGLVAEAEPEAIIPLSKFTRMFDDLSREQAETNEYLRGIYEDKVFRHELRRGF